MPIIYDKMFNVEYGIKMVFIHVHSYDFSYREENTKVKRVIAFKLCVIGSFAPSVPPSLPSSLLSLFPLVLLNVICKTHKK